MSESTAPKKPTRAQLEQENAALREKLELAERRLADALEVAPAAPDPEQRPLCKHPGCAEPVEPGVEFCGRVHPHVERRR